MGEVYLAHDDKLGRQVAIKMLPAAFATDPERLTRFEREAKLLASLNHPNIAAIYEIVESDGVPALILELIEGETLEDCWWLAPGSRLPAPAQKHQDLGFGLREVPRSVTAAQGRSLEPEA